VKDASEFVYTEVHRCESWGDGRHEGMRVLISVPEELTDDEKHMIRRDAEATMDKLRLSIASRDLKAIAEGKVEQDDLLACFPASTVCYVEKIPNGYWSAASPYGVNHPWLVVTTPVGRITIGWRKRVISIDWTDSSVNLTADAIFPSEEVTKIGCLIHAWGYDKAKEYLAKIVAFKQE
jgi:hypothetical protein